MRKRRTIQNKLTSDNSQSEIERSRRSKI